VSELPPDGIAACGCARRSARAEPGSRPALEWPDKSLAGPSAPALAAVAPPAAPTAPAAPPVKHPGPSQVPLGDSGARIGVQSQ
jgi:hypothetical protein